MARIAWVALLVLATAGCGVSKEEYDAKAKEAEEAKAQVGKVQSSLANDESQIAQLKTQLSTAQSAAMTDEQKAQLQESQDRSKLLDELQGKFKKLIDAGHLRVTVRHGRVVLQLHNDVLFDTGEAEVKPAGKAALGEIAATLRGVPGKRFQVAGHTDSQPITTEKKKIFPTNWELSTARAIAVVKLLTSEGVDPANLSAAGYGPYDPVAGNGTPDGQAKNRRIEITLVPNVASLVPPPAPTPAPAPAPTPVASAAAPAASH
ncbi:MAG TPA: OmpA family protein [Polyangiaceae bacterium]|jgi:chemotaxis protein MotB